MTRIPFAGLFAGGSLRGRLLAPIVATSVFVSAAGIALVLDGMRSNYEARMRQECALLLAAVANSVQAAPSPEDLQRFVSAMGAERDVETLLIAAGTPARVIACSKRAWVGQLVSALPDGGDARADVARVSGRGPEMAPHWESSGVFDMTRTIWIPAAGDRSGKLVPGIIMVHVRSAETEAAMFHQALDFSLVVLALIVALALIVRALIERRVLTPLGACPSIHKRSVRAPGHRSLRAALRSGWMCGGPVGGFRLSDGPVCLAMRTPAPVHAGSQVARSFSRLCAVQISDHSWLTRSTPRRRN